MKKKKKQPLYYPNSVQFRIKILSILYPQFLPQFTLEDQKKTIITKSCCKINLNLTSNLDFPSPNTKISAQKPTFCHEYVPQNCFCIFTYSRLPFSGDFRYLISGQSDFKQKKYIDRAFAILYS